MRAWLELKAGVHREREGVTHLILLLTFPSPGIFQVFLLPVESASDTSHSDVTS